MAFQQGTGGFEFLEDLFDVHIFCSELTLRNWMARLRRA
jgi:hypothetical protein